MYRRLFFLFPDKQHTESAIGELHDAGIDKGHMHAILRNKGQRVVLPRTSSHQQHNLAWFTERFLWFGNLTIFAVASVATFATMFWGYWIEPLISLVIAYVAYVAADRFSSDTPHEESTDIQEALDSGEVLLMVDVPKKRAVEIEEKIHRQHPEAKDNGVGLSIDPLGI
ncbi:MAG: hypothetical protein ACC650_01840 [Gammaproteobacteria bacterium]